MPGSRRSLTLKRALTFVQDGEPRTVDIGAPMPVERDGRWMVRLMDLWVATMLPGDIFDLSFRVVTGVVCEADPACLVDGMLFARGFIDTATRQLWWSDPPALALVGACPRTIVVCRSVEQAPAPREPGRPSVADLRRLLPGVATSYPAIEWRETRRAG